MARSASAEASGLSKTSSGVAGLDEITGGGLPAGRPTLVCGGAGCGKTLLATTFLVRGATDHGEPGVFVAFEERADDLIQNVSSLGYDLDQLVADRKIAIDHVRIERSEIEETGEYDLEGLFVRLGFAIDSIGAKRVVLDTVETLFAGLANEAILRAELRRLFAWLKDKGVTAIITGERGEGTLTRHGLEEYVSDCVILLDHRVQEQVSTRRLRIVKYRGSAHGTNEYPFLIDERGISVMPITSTGLHHAASEARITSGVPAFDEMLGGEGYYRGSAVLVSGMGGSGKSSMAAHFADGVCRAGERCIFFAFEESPSQIVRNMRSIGLDLQPWLDRKLLRFSANRPHLFGLEMHLASMHREIEEFAPAAVVVDPLSSFMMSGEGAVHALILRLIDHIKSTGITALFTNLTHGSLETARTDAQVSSLMDTWILLYNREANGEHNRQLYLLKSRGMAHSNQVREFLLTDGGIQLRDAYTGPGGALTGTARLMQEARERAETRRRRDEMDRHLREMRRDRARIEAQMQALREELESKQADMERIEHQARAEEEQHEESRRQLAVSRRAVRRRAAE